MWTMESRIEPTPLGKLINCRQECRKTLGELRCSVCDMPIRALLDGETGEESALCEVRDKEQEAVRWQLIHI